MFRPLRTLLVLAVLLASVPSQAETITIGVEDKNWSPYYYWVDGAYDEVGHPSGACVDIATAVFERMGASVTYLRGPWVRLIENVRLQRTDGLLCASRSAEREEFAIFAEPPLLDYAITLFSRSERPINFSDHNSLKEKSYGVVRGYNYGPVHETLQSAGMLQLEAQTRRSLIKLVLAGKVNALLDSPLPIDEEIRLLGYEGQLKPVNPPIAVGEAHMLFGNSARHKTLSAQFSETLRDFQSTEDYRRIIDKYLIEQR